MFDFRWQPSQDGRHVISQDLLSGDDGQTFCDLDLQVPRKVAVAHLPRLLRVGEEPHVIREDRELLAELKEVTTHATDFVISVLGATPVNPESQRELAERLLTTGQLLLDHTNAGHIINGYLNGCVPDTPRPLLG